jgi:hypothetical protein
MPDLRELPSRTSHAHRSDNARGDMAPLSASPWADPANAGTMNEHRRPVHLSPTRSAAPAFLANRASNDIMEM